MMEDILLLNKAGTVRPSRKPSLPGDRNNEAVETLRSLVLDKLILEGGEIFYNYLNHIGLTDHTGMMVISPRHHYYDHKDFAGITTLINQKKLNLMRHLDSFLHIVHKTLSHKASLIGCFQDGSNSGDNKPLLPVYKRSIGLPGTGLSLEIDKINVSELLESHGFKVLDMTDIMGLTYFRAQKLKHRNS